MNNWNWHPKRQIGDIILGLFRSKRFVFGVVILAIILGGVALGQGPLFHSTQAAPPCAPDIHRPGAPCEDPSQVIWQSTSSSGNLNDFQTTGTVTYQGSCTAPSPCMRMVASTTSTTIALTKTGIGDLNSASKNLLAFHFTMAALNLRNTNAPWGYYLTTNSTVPTHDIGAANAYNPLDDPSVALVAQSQCSSNCNLGSFVWNELGFAQRKIGESIISESTGSCNSSGSLYLCPPNLAPGSPVEDSAFYLNYTGVVNAGACTVTGNPGVFGPAPGCSWMLLQRPTDNAQAAFWTSTQNLPFFSLTSQYYLGMYQMPDSNTPTTEFSFNTGSGNMDVFSFVPQTTAPTIDTGGFFGPVIRALISIGVFVLNAILGFIAFIAPAIQTALSFLESIIQNILNLIGNALGFGNIGTNLFSLLNSIVTFFTNNSYGFPAFFGFFATYITNFLRYLQIDFQFLTPVFTIANAILIFGVNGIAEAFTIFLQGVNMLFFGYGTFIVFAYFLYVGDDGIGGLFTFLGTLEAISFKILNSIVTVTNVGLDFLVTMVSLVPKPLIQMSAARIPRLPTVEYAASMVFPKLDFAEARNGNLVVYWLWCMGLWFMAWFESQNPALPGSLVAIDPALATNVRNLSAYIPLLQAATLISGGVLLAWLCLLPMRLAGIDVTEAPLGASLGRATGSGPTGVKISGGKKHLIGPAKKAQERREAEKGSKVKKEEQAKKAIEAQKKKIEEERRAKELQKREIERKPTGKDLKGPNLGPLG